MKHKLEKINEDVQKTCSETSDELRTAAGHLEQIKEEQHRVTKLSGQAARIVDQIDMDFKVKTELSSVDITLLFLATSVQCARQYLLTNEKFRIQDRGRKKSNERGEELMKAGYQKTVGQLAPPSWEKILFQSVPYDAFQFYSPDVKEQLGNIGLGGSTHRYRTLGHDPVLGWIFGPLNIMTDALTLFDFQSFYIKNKCIFGYYPSGTPGMLGDAIRFSAQEPLLLPTAVARHAIHFGSDYFTKQGLPVPLIATVNNDLAQKMLSKQWRIDAWSVTRGAALSALINQLVCLIHQLFYDEKKHGSPRLYEVRTRKILSYSNMMATGSNVIVTAFTQDMTKLDVGGMLVTLSRIVSDYQFIHEVKKDFLKNELYDRVVGSEYDFMKGDS